MSTCRVSAVSSWVTVRTEVILMLQLKHVDIILIHLKTQFTLLYVWISYYSLHTLLYMLNQALASYNIFNL